MTRQACVLNTDLKLKGNGDLELEERDSAPSGSRHSGEEEKLRALGWGRGMASGAQWGLLRRDSVVILGDLSAVLPPLRESVLESPLDSKEIKPINPKGNQS